MNNDNNNFSLIRNEEINRLGPQWIQPRFFNTYKVNEVMKEKVRTKMRNIYFKSLLEYGKERIGNIKYVLQL